MRFMLLVAIVMAWFAAMHLAAYAMNAASDLALYGGVLFALAFTLLAARLIVRVLRTLF